jgi:hypothetical protein
MGNRPHRVSAGFAFSNNDDLIEDYSGVRVGFESRPSRTPTDRLGRESKSGASTRRARVHARGDGTNPTLRKLYRKRLTVVPSVTFRHDHAVCPRDREGQHLGAGIAWIDLGL